MKLGIGEILIILVVILFIIGPDKIPDFARKVAEGLRAFRTATSGVTKEIRENVIEPLNEAQAPLREALEPINEIRTEINSLTSGIKQDAQDIADGLNAEVKSVTDDLSQTGKEIKDAAAEAVAQGKEALYAEHLVRRRRRLFQSLGGGLRCGHLQGRWQKLQILSGPGRLQPRQGAPLGALLRQSGAVLHHIFCLKFFYI